MDRLIDRQRVVNAAREAAGLAARDAAWNYDTVQVMALEAVRAAFERFADALEVTP